ncbi:hypothetical protein [Thalassospira sp.]|uniref:hypothetical protein n=1 Tax=Thalassospira sp. TaxID=1912094 RepID=UPI000C3F2AB8|nr:hypothetical protein [Thalassospira sp.]MBC05671.1 hypothetical protein [Thalassospira sp.]
MEAFQKTPEATRILAIDDDGWRGIVPTMLFAFVGVMLLVVLSYRPSDAMSGVGMVFPFDMSEQEILERVGASGGRVARFGGFGHMAVVVRDDGTLPEAGDFGALFTLSPLIASACFDADAPKNAF